ncbi:MAG: hypothetical protein ACRDCG_00700 [Mycoplasmoidaceae bacterium]
MNIKIDRLILLKYLNYSFFLTCLNEKINNPILKNVLLEVKNKKIYLKIISNNICKTIFSFRNEFQNSSDYLLIDPKKIIDVIQYCNEKYIIMNKVDDSILRISYKNYEINLNILDWEYYPNFKIGGIDKANKIDLNINDILFINKKISFPSQIDYINNLKFYNSIQFNSIDEEGMLNIYYTNSVQFSIWTRLYNGIKFKFSFQKDIFKIIETIVKNSEIFHIYFFDNKLYIFNDNVKIEIKNWEDLSSSFQFLDVKKFLNNNNNNNISVCINKKDIINALEKSLILKSFGLKSVEFYVSKNQLVIKSKENNIGNSKEIISIKSKNLSESFYINVDITYILSMIKIHDGEEIEIDFGGNSSNVRIDPIIIKNNINKNYIQIIVLSSV